MKRIALMFGCLCLLAVGVQGCKDDTTDDGGSGGESVCGDGGTIFSIASNDYCAYGDGDTITEEGFLCPASLPEEIVYGDVVVCSAESELPDELLERLRGAFPGATPPPSSGCAAVTCGPGSVCDEATASCVPRDGGSNNNPQTTCETDADCPEGEICDECGGSSCPECDDCVAVCFPGAANSANNNNNNNNPAVGGCCLPAGGCQDATREECAELGAFTEGMTCGEGACSQVAPNNVVPQCSANSDCAEGEICDECGGSSCPECDDCIAVCVQGSNNSNNPAVGGCCLPAGGCQDATREECAELGAFTEGMTCGEGACSQVAPNNVVPQCSANSDCAEGEVCDPCGTSSCPECDDCLPACVPSGAPVCDYPTEGELVNCNEMNSELCQCAEGIDVSDYGQGCSVDLICGDLVGIDCGSAADGPYIYVNGSTGDIVDLCGGYCFVPEEMRNPGECEECPPSEWTCDSM